MLYMFDIDGTLIRSFLREGGDRSEFDLIEVLPGRREKVRLLAEEPGTRFALVTNQGGVAFGYQTEEQVWRKVAGVAAEFEMFHARPVSFHVACGHPKGTVERWAFDDVRRKPGPGMLMEAIYRHGHLGNAVFVGDMDSDRLAAAAAQRQCRFAHVALEYVDAQEFFA